MILSQFHNSKVTPHKATPKSSHIHSGWEQGVPLPILIFIMNFFWDTLYRTNINERRTHTKKSFFIDLVILFVLFLVLFMFLSFEIANSHLLASKKRKKI